MKLLAIALLALGLVPGAAQADPQVKKNPDWGWCCNDRDCRLATPSEMHWTPAGWVVRGAEGAIKETEQGFHWIDHGKPGWYCADPETHKLICVFVPEVEL